MSASETSTFEAQSERPSADTSWTVTRSLSPASSSVTT